ncbi:MAG: hypothetical protein BBJ57_10310 [Desulfobacterales bacterium PC51MH44]|nr:MAG: hypothetical protein BBJ57_10310 [Desulfobacterales bacterium PC51MH44]
MNFNKIRNFSKASIYKLKINFIITFFAVFVLLSSFSQSSAGPALTIDPDKQFDFAKHYFLSGEYFRAIDEYKRFIYFFPEDNKVKIAMYKIGMSYFNSKSFNDAINSFNTLIDKYSDTDFSMTDLCTKAYLMISKCHIHLNEYDFAAICLNNLITITDDIDVKDEAYYQIGWIYLEKASWEKARINFAKISPQNKNKYQLKSLSKELDRTKLIDRKSPQAAGLLSIIPGAGFLYCERYRDAMIAFLLNAGLMYAAYESFDDDNYALGGMITFVEVGFYAGNFYGAITSAHKYNRSKTGQFIDQLKQNTKINLTGSNNQKSIILSLQYSF